jgi:VanZ family protein
MEADAVRAARGHGLTGRTGTGTSGRPKRLFGAGPARAGLAWFLVVAWAAVIFALSATPNLRFAEADTIDFVVRKPGHMAAFGILAVLLWRAISYSRGRGAVAVSLVLTVLYAASDEFHQSFTAGRHPSLVDVAIDSVGALIALLALTAWLRLRSRRPL